LIEQDKNNIFNIPKDKLHPEIKKKYQYLFSMKKAGIL